MYGIQTTLVSVKTEIMNKMKMSKIVRCSVLVFTENFSLSVGDDSA